MSHNTWHNYGYGICTDKLENAPVERIHALIRRAPVFEAKVLAEFQKDNIMNPTSDDFSELDCAGCYGIASIMEQVIREAEHLTVTACDNYDCINYLLYMPDYPWNIQEHEQELTEDSVRLIFAKYVHILTDEELEVDYESVENGG